MLSIKIILLINYTSKRKRRMLRLPMGRRNMSNYKDL